MKKLIAKIILMLVTYSTFSQIKVIDTISNKSVSYVTITFEKNNGLYTDEDGFFSLDEIKCDQISLSCLGYSNKKINVKSIQNNTIYLSPINYELSEVVISDKVRKSKTKKIKPEKHNDFMQSHRLSIGGELAMYIPNDYSDNDIEFMSLTIPIVTKTISFDKSLEGKSQRLKKLPFSALYKISFYANEENKPGEQFNYENITVVLDEESTKVDVDLEDYNITLPEEGFFISLLNLGKTDEDGKLISTTPFESKEVDNRMVKYTRPTKPYFPVHYEENKNKTFFRYSFNDDKSWITFYKHGKKKEGEYHNVSLGYELKIY
jgi:hypothetical protein